MDPLNLSQKVLAAGEKTQLPLLRHLDQDAARFFLLFKGRVDIMKSMLQGTSDCLAVPLGEAEPDILDPARGSSGASVSK